MAWRNDRCPGCPEHADAAIAKLRAELGAHGGTLPTDAALEQALKLIVAYPDAPDPNAPRERKRAAKSELATLHRQAGNLAAGAARLEAALAKLPGIVQEALAGGDGSPDADPPRPASGARSGILAAQAAQALRTLSARLQAAARSIDIERGRTRQTHRQALAAALVDIWERHRGAPMNTGMKRSDTGAFLQAAFGMAEPQRPLAPPAIRGLLYKVRNSREARG